MDDYPDFHLTLVRGEQAVESRTKRYRDIHLCWNWLVGDGRILLYMVMHEGTAIRVTWERLEGDRLGGAKWRDQPPLTLRPGETAALVPGWALRCEPLVAQQTLFEGG